MEATPIVRTEATVCPKCGSTDRTPYRGITVRPQAGRMPGSGTPYNTIKQAYTTCRDCGQVRIDKVFQKRRKPPERQRELVKWD